MNTKSNKNHIDTILRVDHAGETAAAKIYDGQLAVLKNTPVGPTIQHMKDQEQEHLDTFNDLLNDSNLDIFLDEISLKEIDFLLFLIS